MKVLIVGGGGREHAIAWKISTSPKVEKIYCAPGNAGIEEYAECVDIGVMEFDRIAAFAKEKQIDFQAVIRFEAGSFMEPLDISTIFGNALDNAIEASEKVSESMRLITAKASRIHDMLVVAVENNMMLDLPKDAKTSKEDIFLHGFGLSNIRKAAEKYDGQCTTKAKDGKFVLKVMIPIPE